MSADIIDTPCPATLTKPVAVSREEREKAERDWKSSASKALQEFGRDKQDADSHADYLYQIYVSEGGFTNYDFSLDPYGAASDDDSYKPESRTKKTLTVP